MGMFWRCCCHQGGPKDWERCKGKNFEFGAVTSKGVLKDLAAQVKGPASRRPPLGRFLARSSKSGGDESGQCAPMKDEQCV